MRIPLNGADWRILGLVPSEWVWRKIGSEGIDLDALVPPAGPWLPAQVPGDVQSDLLDLGLIPDPKHDLDSRACEWTSQRDWVYRKTFRVPSTVAGKPATLRFQGVDYSCHVFLNGRELGAHAGTYTPFEFDVGELLLPDAPNELVVVVEHAPMEPDQQAQVGWTGKVRLWKPRFAYTWDWCTRLIPLGIWDDVDLIVADPLCIHICEVRSTVADGVGHVSATVEIRGSSDACGAVHLDVYSPVGHRVGRSETPVRTGHRQTIALDVPDPDLWFPNGIGDHPLYRIEVTVVDRAGIGADVQSCTVGFRTLRASANDDAPADALPYVLEVNNRRVFMKGWNWAPIDQLYGRKRDIQYRAAIAAAREANCNLLRVWGGGLLERELFYQLCDEAGILVWQEFHQSSSGIQNEPATDDEYITYVTEQAQAIVPRRCSHPSLAMWCGGNELFTPDWVPLTNDHPTISALRAVVTDLDPDRLFLPTSPSGPVFAALAENVGRMHDVHGHWQYLGDPAHYEFYNTIDPLLHSEYGVEGAANIETLRRTLSPERLWPPDGTNPAWVHHGAWWLNRAAVERLFGETSDIEDFVRCSQWVQAEGLRYAAEATRRRQWRTSGTMPWQFNEPWPNASGTYVLDYYGRPKPAYWTMRTAYGQHSVTAQYEAICQTGGVVKAQVWVCSTPGVVDEASVRWIWRSATDGAVVDQGAIGGAACARASARMVADLVLPTRGRPAVYVLDIIWQSESAILARNQYVFSTHDDTPLAELRRAPSTDVAVTTDGLGIILRTGDVPVVGLRISADGDWSATQIETGYAFWVPPDTHMVVPASQPGHVTVSAWNAPTHHVQVG